MTIKILSAAMVGLEATVVEVEADVGAGELGLFVIVGLPDAAVSESKERVRSAVKNSGFDFPKQKVTVNLAPASLKKYGPSYDLPIAVSVLAATGKIQPTAADSIFIGELALDGSLRPVAGVLSIALQAKDLGFKNLFVPQANATEAKLVEELTVYGLGNLKQLVDHLRGRQLLEPTPVTALELTNNEAAIDLAQISGQDQAKRALEIAAAGGHNILLWGPPGSGKTMLARALVSILPDLTLAEALEITRIYSVAGALVSGQALVKSRPFRSPHHTASAPALVGGGTWPRPGEISLAHRGVLFLDEFAEFPRIVLDSLRQPLEDGIVTVARVAGSLIFPAKFILAAAMNPCPCGFLHDRAKPCICSLGQVAGYRRKISGPISDRIDLHVEVPRLPFAKLEETTAGETSAAVKQRVEATRQRQRQRFAGTPFLVNAEMNSEAVRRWCRLDETAKQLVAEAVNRLDLSPRAYFRVLKLARTIADLAGREQLLVQDVAEALQYRPKN